MKGPFFADWYDSQTKREYFTVNTQANHYALVALGFFLTFSVSLLIPMVVDVESLPISKYLILVLLTFPSLAGAFFFFFRKAMPLADKRIELLETCLNEEIAATRTMLEEAGKDKKDGNSVTLH